VNAPERRPRSDGDRASGEARDRPAALATLAKAAELGAPPRRWRNRRVCTVAAATSRSALAIVAPRARRRSTDRSADEVAERARPALTELRREAEAVVAAYLDMLGIEPDQTEALAGIEEPARKLGLWDELARAFRGAKQTPRNLEVLAEALHKIAEWSELAEVRRKQLEAATAPADKARRATELAMLYEHELGDHEAAVRMLAVAQGAVPDDGRQQDLLRLLRVAQRWPELATALERELPTLKPTDTDRIVALLLELADLRANKLEKKPEAIQAYEAVLERRAGEPTAATALETLYEQTGRERELARMLEVRAEGTADPTARGQLFARVAALRVNRSDVEGSIAAYSAAFAADPANREVFTAMERVCYKAERWAVAMQLYEGAIQYVEGGNSRAYRLGDLYLRRGNVQLNFLGLGGDAVYQKVIESTRSRRPRSRRSTTCARVRRTGSR
jgi:tetratricopeptide (TPR) repeat protein